MTDESASASSSMPENIPVLQSTPLREDLIATAVKFLQNPKVQSSPLKQKKDFMKKKGLTEQEIEKAVKLAGVSETSTYSVQNNEIVPSAAYSPAVVTEPVSSWSKFRDYSSFAILMAGIFYGLYLLYKRFIEPVFVRHQKQQTEKLTIMEKHLSELNSNLSQNLKDLQNTINLLQTQLSDQNIKLGALSSDLTDCKENSFSEGSKNSLSVLQNEVTSLKALLLGTKQFPSAPSVPPVIPSWQMKPSPGAICPDQPEETGDGPKPISGVTVQSSDEETKTKAVSKSDLERNSCDASDRNVNGETPHEGAVNNDSSETNLSSDFENMNGHLVAAPTKGDPTQTGSDRESSSLNSSAGEEIGSV